MNYFPPLYRRVWNYIFLIFYIAGFQSFAHAQPLKIWDKTLGGTSYEELNALVVLPDGFVAGGSTLSNAAFGFPNDTSYNFLIYKLALDGSVLWQRFFPTEKTDRLWNMIATSDGGFLTGGYSYSDAGAFKSEDNRGDMDVWIIKLDGSGNRDRDRTYGGTSRDELFDMLELPNQAGYLLGCHSKSDRGFEKSDAHRGAQDFWVIRTDLLGNIIYDKTIGGAGREQFHDMAFTPDGNVVLVGSTGSTPNSGELSGDFARGGQDFWMVKIEPLSGDLLWNHRYGGTAEEMAYSVCVLNSGEILLGGRTKSEAAPPTTANNGKDAMFYGGDSDFWVVKTDSEGRKLRDWSFGGNGLDDLYYILEDWSGNIYLGGVSDSEKSGSKTTNRKGGYDIWLISLDKHGEKRWERTIGGTKSDALTKMALCPAGSLVLGGHSMSDLGFDKSENSKGQNDFWVVNYCCQLQPTIQMLGDSTPCTNEPLLLEAKTAGCDSCAYFWSNGEIGKNIEVFPGTSDTFTVTMVSREACLATASKFVDLPMPPVIDLGLRDTAVFEYETLIIGGNNPALKYKWNTGDTTSTLAILYSGVFAVTVTDENGCTATDWMKVERLQRSHVWVPNIFSPNFDGSNDYVNIYADESVERIITYQIADRWGNVYFRKDDFEPNYETDGWDGTFRGNRAPPGVYTWMAQIEYFDGKRAFVGGTVYLKR